jgi:hypothetical protein
MTNTDNTSHTEITWELDDLISNLTVMMNLHCLESNNENDKDAVAQMTHIYGQVLIKDFGDIRNKISELEKLYIKMSEDNRKEKEKVIHKLESKKT